MYDPRIVVRGREETWSVDRGSPGVTSQLRVRDHHNTGQEGPGGGLPCSVGS